MCGEKKAMKFGYGVIVGLVLATGFAPAYAADPVADFYKGRNVDLMVGTGVGGGYDVYARLIAPRLSRHIPGNPTVTVRNVTGAGGLILANQLTNSLPKDGTVIGMLPRSIPLESLFGNTEAKFKPEDLKGIGSATGAEVSLCLSWHLSPVKTFADVVAKGMVVGGTGDIYPGIINNVLKTRIKVINAFPSGNEIMLAMERGEVDGRCGDSWSSVKLERADWIRDKELNLLLQISTEKSRNLPDVPLIMDQVTNPQDRQVLQTVLAGLGLGRPFVTTSAVPVERVKALQEAFAATMKDPDLLQQAETSKLEIDPISAEKLDQMIRAAGATPKEVIDRAIAVIKTP
jgi:tripartite-type tricarboxylate transporter receptor subunit TctC